MVLGISRSVLFSQLRSCFGVMLLSMVEGMAIGWASPAIKKLQKDGDAPFVADDDDISWIVSVFDLGVLLGGWTSALVFTLLGRKQTIFVGPTALAAWIALTAVGASPAMLIVARILAGMGMGIALSFSFIYVGEVASPVLRGPLVMVTTLLMPTGQLLAFLLGSRIPWIWQAVYPAPFVITMMLCVIFLMVETPYYYAMKGMPDEMERSLRRLRVGMSEERIKEEGANILRVIKQQKEDATTALETFSAPGAKKAAFIVMVVASALAVLGVTPTLAYTQQIFINTGGDIMDDVWSSVLVISVEIAMLGVAVYAVERLGRRVQLSLAATGTCLSSLALGIYCVFRELTDYDVSSWNWVPLVSLAAFIGAVGGGINSVPHVIMSELLSQRAKAVIAPVCMTIMSLTSFGINNRFLPVGKDVGFYVPFMFFAFTNFSLVLFTLFVVPETKGKSLAEVHDMLRGGKSSRKNKEPLP